MGWVTLTSRKVGLTEAKHQGQMQLLNYSRQTRAVQRQYSYDETVTLNDKQDDLDAARAEYDAHMDKRSEIDVTSDAYDDWKDEFERLSEEWEGKKVDIEAEYDIILKNLEEESTEVETTIQEQQQVLQAQIEAWTAELESLDESISSDIKSSTIKLGG